MQDIRLNVLTIGNAIVDVLAETEDDFLKREGIVKGSMTLIDEGRADHLYDRMNSVVEASGGSAANTAAGIASFGGSVSYIGLVKDDVLGKIFDNDLKTLGVEHRLKFSPDGPGTGRCLVMITPDAERSMNTYLGAAANLSEETLDLALIRDASITYLEGYLFDRAAAKAAYFLAAKTAHAAGRKVSLSLSDSFCVHRHRSDFRQLVQAETDILFANEDEILALYDVDTFEDAVAAVRMDCEMACLTRGKVGSALVTADTVHHIKALEVDRVVDTTGAGDQYAAGVLYGLTNGATLDVAGHYGSIAASEVITHVGPRPELELSSLLQQNWAAKF